MGVHLAASQEGLSSMKLVSLIEFRL
jgi:hypothetical protein